MITDAKLVFDSEVAVTDGSTSTNVVDIGSLSKIAKGTPIYFNLVVNTAFSVDTETVDILVCNSDTNPPEAADVILTKQLSVAATQLGKKGFVYRAALPDIAYLDYLNVVYVATTAVATGKVSAFLTIGQDSD
jgi:hypothetical protein